MSRNFTCLLQSERRYTEYDSNSRIFWKRQNDGDSKKDQWLSGNKGREGWIGKVHGVFRAVQTILCDSKMVGSLLICPNP